MSTWSADTLAVAYVSATSGNWNTAATWSPAGTPGAGDTVTVQSGHTVTVASDVNSVGAVTISLGGTITAPKHFDPDALTVAGTLNSSDELKIGGAFTITGTVNITDSSGAGEFNGAITITGGNFNNSGNKDFKIRNGLTVNGGTFTAGTGTYTFDTNNQAIGGTTAITMAKINVTGVVLTNNNVFTVTTDFKGDGSSVVVNAANATLNIGDPTPTIGDLTASATGNTVNYNGAAQNPILLPTGSPATYYNLTLSGSGAKTLKNTAMTIANDFTLSGTASATAAQALTVGRNFTIGSGTSFDAKTFSHSVAGDFLNSGTFTAGSSMITFTGGSAQTLGGTTATAFNDLTINKSANSVTIACGTPSPVVNGTLALTSGKIITSGASPGCSTACASQVPIIVAAAPATITGGSSSSYVQGALRKNFGANATLNFRATASEDEFPIGDATNYTPVEFTAGGTSTAGNVTACVTPTEHPQVTTPPVATGGIDAAKSVNRYWSLTTTTINTASGAGAVPVDATYKFVAGDVDGGASTANFVVQRWDGTIWNPTTQSTASAASTRAQNIDFSSATNDFAIGEPLSGFNATPGAFNAFETSTPAGAILGRIYAKIVGTAITLSVVAVNSTRTGVNTAPSGLPITVVLLDARNNTGAITAATNCRSTWTSVLSSQTIGTAWGGIGRFNITIPAPANAARDVRVRVSQLGGTAGCSTDRFSIRPTAYTSITSSMNNSTAAGAPSLKTGQNFTITALTGLTGYDNGAGLTLASPPLVPLIDNTKVVGSPNAGSIGGSFGAASGGTATGAGFYYSEAGNFGLNAGAIYDNAYTAVDQLGDCTADFSNTPVGGKYGCSFGNSAIALGGGFGRFIPDNFNVSLNSPQLGAACAAGPFTYVGQQFSYTTAPAITVTARNGTNNGLANAPTTNYAGAYMKITNASLTPGTQSGRYSAFDALGGGATPALDTAGLPAPTADPAVGAFAAGVGTLTFGAGTGLTFTRSTTTPSAPFNADIALAVNVIDADGVASAGNPAAFGSATAGGGIAFSGGSGGKSMRYGRLRLQNASGSQLISMPIPISAQYWNGSGFITNTLDNCTVIAAGNIAIGNPQNGLTAAMVSPPVVGGAFSAGIGSLRLPAPGAGGRGSVDVSVNLTTGTAGASCTTSPAMPPSTGSGLTWLQGAWCGGAYVKDPTARATFGVFRNTDRFIYQRENY